MLFVLPFASLLLLAANVASFPAHPPTHTIVAQGQHPEKPSRLTSGHLDSQRPDTLSVLALGDGVTRSEHPLAHIKLTHELDDSVPLASARSTSPASKPDLPVDEAGPPRPQYARDVAALNVAVQAAHRTAGIHSYAAAEAHHDAAEAHYAAADTHEQAGNNIAKMQSLEKAYAHQGIANRFDRKGDYHSSRANRLALRPMRPGPGHARRARAAINKAKVATRRAQRSITFAYESEDHA